MARGANPYYADAGQYNGIAEGLSNLGQAFLQGSDPVRKAQAEQAAWQARTARERVLDSQQARQGRQTVGDMFSNYDPATYSPADIIGTSIGSGALDPGDIGRLMLVGAGNLPGMSDEQRAGALVGVGQTIGENQGVSLGDREGIADRNQDNAVQLQGMRDAAAMARTQATIAGAMDRHLTPKAGSGAGGALDPMDATRLADLEGDAYKAIDTFAEGLGLDPASLPPELRTYLGNEAVNAARAGQPLRGTIGSLFDSANVRMEDTNSWWPGGDALQYEIPGAAGTSGGPSQAPAGGDQLLLEAQDAVSRGADPAAVRERLYSAGYTDDQIAQAGL